MHKKSGAGSLQNKALLLVRKLLQIDFVRFCIVGGVGFVVHSTVFFVLRKLGVFPEVAYLIGAESALFSNFTFHHFWTYGPQAVKKRKRILLTQFHVSFWSGALINFGVFVLIIRVFKMPEIYGLIAGSASALFWNFFWTKFFIWRRPKDTSLSE